MRQKSLANSLASPEEKTDSVGRVPRNPGRYHARAKRVRLGSPCPLWVKMRRTQSEQNASASPPIADIQTGLGLPSLRAKRRRRSGHLGAISSRIRSCGHLLRERSKSNDDFGCLLTGANNIIERLPHFLQSWRVSAQPV